MFIPAEGCSDAYKAGMSVLHDLVLDGYNVKVLHSYSNFTPRKNAYMKFSDSSDGKIVVYGTRDTFKSVIDLWNSTFFEMDKEVVLKRLNVRTKHIFGTLKEHTRYLQDISDLWEVGYLPIEVRSIDEGTRYPIGLPVFTVKSTIPGFGWLVNYLETVTSGLIWPMINTATKVEQFYLQAKEYGLKSAPKEIVDQWLPICVHEFGMRGYRGTEDQVRTSSAHNVFFEGSDTMSSVDFFMNGYDADPEVDSIACSVRASEHADISRMLSLFRLLAKLSLDRGEKFLGEDPQAVLEDTELYVLKWFIENSTGIMSYVSDTEDYYRLINVYAKELKGLIESRKAREDGQPAILVFRPDSSRHRPLNVICGYEILETVATYEVGETIYFDDASDEVIAVLSNGKYMLATKVSVDTNGIGFVLDVEISQVEAEGSLISLWNTFGGVEMNTAAGMMKFINPSVGLIYGEAISQSHQVEIYERMIEMGFSAVNILMGKGSYSSLENSTRDLFSMSYKQTFSIVEINGEEYNLEQQKKPMGDSSKTSAKGLLRVEKEGDSFVLHQNQTIEQEATGELTLLVRDGVFYKKQTLSGIKDVYAGKQWI